MSGLRKYVRGQTSKGDVARLLMSLGVNAEESEFLTPIFGRAHISFRDVVKIVQFVMSKTKLEKMGLPREISEK